jgi:hypothetical protein
MITKQFLNLIGNSHTEDELEEYDVTSGDIFLKLDHDCGVETIDGEEQMQIYIGPEVEGGVSDSVRLELKDSILKDQKQENCWFIFDKYKLSYEIAENLYEIQLLDKSITYEEVETELIEKFNEYLNQ